MATSRETHVLRKMIELGIERWCKPVEVCPADMLPNRRYGHMHDMFIKGYVTRNKLNGVAHYRITERGMMEIGKQLNAETMAGLKSPVDRIFAVLNGLGVDDHPAIVAAVKELRDEWSQLRENLANLIGHARYVADNFDIHYAHLDKAERCYEHTKELI